MVALCSVVDLTFLSQVSDGFWLPAIMIAIKLRLQTNKVVERQGSSVLRFHLQAGAFCSLVLSPGRQACNHAPSIAASLPAWIRDHRFVTQQAIVDSAIGQRHKF